METQGEGDCHFSGGKIPTQHSATVARRQNVDRESRASKRELHRALHTIFLSASIPLQKLRFWLVCEIVTATKLSRKRQKEEPVLMTSSRNRQTIKKTKAQSTKQSTGCNEKRRFSRQKKEKKRKKGISNTLRQKKKSSTLQRRTRVFGFFFP